MTDAAAPDALPFRKAPHNIEAEQALLSPPRLRFARVRSPKRPEPPSCDPIQGYLRLSAHEMRVEAAAMWAAEQRGKKSPCRPPRARADRQSLAATMPARRRDPDSDGRIARALRIRISSLRTERRAKRALWLRRDRSHRRKQIELLDEIVELGERMQRLRSLVHGLEFVPQDEGEAA